MADLTIRFTHQLPLQVVRERLRALLPELRRALQNGDPKETPEISFGENSGSFKRTGLEGEILLLPDAVLVTATFTAWAKRFLDDAKLSQYVEDLDRGIRARLRAALAPAPQAPPQPAPAPPAAAPIPLPGPLDAAPADSSPVKSEAAPTPAPTPRRRRAAATPAAPKEKPMPMDEIDDLSPDGAQYGPPDDANPNPVYGPPADAAPDFIGPPDLRTPEEKASLPDLPELEIDDTDPTPAADQGGEGDYSTLTPDSEEKIAAAQKKYNPAAGIGPLGGAKKAKADGGAASADSDVANVLGKVLPQITKSASEIAVAAINRNQPRAPIPAPGPLYTPQQQAQQAQQQQPYQQQPQAQQPYQPPQQPYQPQPYQPQAQQQPYQQPQAAPRQQQPAPAAAQPAEAEPPLVAQSYASPAPPMRPPAGGGAGLAVGLAVGVVVIGGGIAAAAIAMKRR